uniref:Myb/SANT-like domain-containing protein n=2 Tax=Setaria TaxID=4554 RepID=K3ZL69_SETIT
VQEKKKELKANYKALRDAKSESGNGWNEYMCMILAYSKVWEKLIKISHFLFRRSVATGKLNFTSTKQVDPPSPPAPPALPLAAPSALPPPAPPVERSNSKQSCSHLGTNPFASSFDGQETSSAHKGGSGRKRKQSHIGSALQGYVDFKKSQNSKTLQALEERKRCDEEFSVEKCVDQVDAMAELTDNEKSYSLDVFESETHMKIFITTKNPNVRLMWLKQKISEASSRKQRLNMIQISVLGG